jgi:hypothetical protein
MARAKRHHYVPAAYLARFGESDSVLVRRRGEDKLYTPHVKNVAVEGGFYEVLDAHGQPSDAVERALADLEGAALSALTEIDQREQLPPVGSAVRRTLGTFLAVQFTRTPFHRERILFPERVARYAGSREIDASLMAEYLEQIHLGFKPHDNEVRAALDLVQYLLRDREFFTKDNAIRLAFGTVNQLEQAILGMHWSLEIARKPRLITSDAPLVLWRKPTFRDRFEGIGLMNAEEVRFPIIPGMQLVLTHQYREPVTRVKPDRVHASNADMALACYRVVVGHPRRERQLRQLDLPARRPVVRFNTGPGYQAGRDGTSEYMGDILHTWVPRR